MSTERNDPAHPVSGHFGQYFGLTKREEFAKAAMIGLLADPEDNAGYRESHIEEYDNLGMKCKRVVYDETCTQAVARMAVEHADALIEALNKKP